MALAVQAQGIAPAPIPQQPPVAQTTQPLPFFPRMKENAVWAWTATGEKLETVGQNLKRLLLKVVEAIREFFAPKFESVKKAAVDLYERFTNKPAPAVVTAPPVPVRAAEPVEAPVVQKAVEEEKPAPAAEAQIFVPQPIEPAPLAVEQPAQVQMPVPAVVIDAPPAAAAAAVAAPAAAPAPVQAEPEQWGIFKVFKGWVQ